MAIIITCDAPRCQMAQHDVQLDSKMGLVLPKGSPFWVQCGQDHGAVCACCVGHLNEALKAATNRGAHNG